MNHLSKGGFFKDLNIVLKNTDKVAFLADNSLAITKLFDVLDGRDEDFEGTFRYGITIHEQYIPSS